jgi:diaminopimelate epimerase
VRLTGAERIETAGGMLQGSDAGSAVEISLVEPRFAWDEIPLAFPMPTDPLPMGWGALAGPQAMNVGNPHLVFFVENQASVDLARLGPEIENDPAFPERINVNVASVQDGAIHLRTWERGAGLTPACGTGACASGIAAIRARLAASPVTVHMPGGSLQIGWSPGQPVTMRGDATHVFSGQIELP